MTLIELVAVSLGCILIQQPLDVCVGTNISSAAAPARPSAPTFTGDSLDVLVSAQSVFAWDVKSGTVLYEKNADQERPVASLSKLASALAVRSLLSLNQTVIIPIEAAKAQRMGAHIKLPIGQHASVQDLLAAAMSASANDAMVSLAVAAKGSEDAFAQFANEHARQLGLEHTVVANATGLEGGTQHSTAREVSTLLQLAYRDAPLRLMLSQKTGTVTTTEETVRFFKSTNELLGTYLPILAAKTGYTVEAGQNLAIITLGKQGQQIGVVALGSDQRFQDVKVLAEWIGRNYTWP